MNLLLVEDDEAVARFLGRALSESGHKLDHATDGANGLARAIAGAYDVVILDRMLPGLDGLAVLRAMRSSGVQTPVLLLTALGGIDDRVQGLEAGGDDYLVKPFAFAELHARLNALARRPPPHDVRTELMVADLRIDLLKRTVTRAGVKIDLQPREFQLLEYLARHAGQVVTRTMLLAAVWGFDFDPKTNIVETHMSRLRAKIDRAFPGELIRTVRGAGYLLRDPG